MIVSVNWLKEITDINVQEELLLEGIPANGLEVEAVKKTGIGHQDIVSCTILTKIKHPEADKLFVTTVDAGSFGTKQIVTNLSNVKVGDKLLVALEGVKITSDFIIKKSKLKNVDSEGMFIGWEELGFHFKSEEPIYLDDTTENGIYYYDLLPFEDTLIDIELTSNRGDCLGMKGIATDIKARFNSNLKEINYSYKSSESSVTNDISVSVVSPNCYRYTGAVIKNVVIKPSPLWMQLKLVKAGIRPINNVVDITNIVLFEMNQPLHAFDLDKITDKKIIVRDANQDEKMVTLDGIERQLEKQDIVIADSAKGHCLGGIMGGQISEVTDTTKNIFLEAAFFNPVTIRKCSRRLGLRSESSYRFEREIDRENVDSGLKRALHFFDLLQIGTISKDIIDVYPVPFQKKVISTTTGWINKKLGTSLTSKEIIDLLSKLDFKAVSDNDNLVVTVPSARNDVSIREDITEEVARIYGYNNIKPTLFPSIKSGVRTTLQNQERKLHSLMIESGCNEVMNFSFVGKSLFDKMILPENHPLRNVVTLEVPLTEDWSSMRSSLIPGLIRTASFNVTRQNRSFSLYEIGNISIPTNDILPIEQKKLGIILTGNKFEKGHCNEEVKYDFFDLKGIIDSILDSYSIEASFVPSIECYLQPYQQADIIIQNKKVGVMGKLHPSVAENFDIEDNVFIAEIDTKMIFDNSKVISSFVQVPKFPSSERDLAIVVKDDIKAEDIIKTVKGTDTEILREVTIFDIYKGNAIEKGYYSLAIKLVYNKIVSTLTDAEIETATKMILNNLESKLNAKLR
ncbi:MAG: phenylalanine--tRNA ligase subunit beta [Spirochaetes bacterium GWF1_31_7]|nr:MAG: phenylalanine--tRNA ligase subunit beta [Spirochaetes bacterium GWE1_32_154]OHD48991.1 MAG: phenylalanine--tRNA ligase subunit beta [Spirochaetes bacterium GWE2_31_10]OHD49569.1 MAG: phenylalanine--tRNA ligase subunit beta [Spirochaetes bacterium GWF1_31_7]HBD95913.1 phenylalanine--tRNA ligase subunit beta [Spirochaetia bacterium]HBI36739.1 phenylalanine--tRNA ligase subunit beta [Spirochaetia bacterium]